MMIADSYANETVQIRSLFDINSAFCSIKTNGVEGVTNRASALEGRGYGTSSTNSMLALENGINEISVEFGSLDWFSDNDDQPKGAFKADSSCSLSLVLKKQNNTQILKSITVSVDNKGIPFMDMDGENINKAQSKGIKIIGKQIEEGHFPDDFFEPFYFPKNMELYEFKKTVFLKGLPEWKWVNATKFTGSQVQTAALREAYIDLWREFAHKNNNAIKQRLHVSLDAWGISTFSTPDEIYEDYNFVESFKNHAFKMQPLNWNDYKIEVMNQGRMVRFVNKTVPTYSPLTYFVKNKNGEERIRSYAPIFSLINGKFIVVI
ncbi:hypothetical protein RIN58_09710 [Siccibacter colletis]|uniref:hypothetical protein n=1 Tax=Siccibacter colletis TaxID=1505757 RepID=UPI0028BE5FF0|nr:hypothetical protein [Siccibacter colletis]WNN50342.1 hypothetical protein RIN58_09710 [Siccibacter colletis]